MTDPAAEYAPLALPRGNREAVVEAMREPGEVALHGELARLEHAGIEAEAGDGTRILVVVLAHALTAEVCDNVLREQAPLAHGVLRVGHAEAAGAGGRGDVGHLRGIARGPGTL